MSVLTDTQIEQFVKDGYVRVDGAFPRELADTCRARLWHDLECDPDDPSTWSKPVVRLLHYGQRPFREAANTPILHAAFDRLVGKGRWIPRRNLGTFPIRFPSLDDPGDAGWHIDAGFAADDSDPDNYATWRVNIRSRGRALLMLFLFSDVGERDAPTRIRAGSHLDVARVLEPAGEAGMGKFDLSMTAHRPEMMATGEAGTVYLCHPFLVHAAQRHHGMTPRFLAQPPLHSAEPFQLNRPDDDYSQVEFAIREGLKTAPR